MEWMIMNPSGLHRVCALLGYTSPRGQYSVNKDTCLEGLDELLTKLMSDGPSLNTRRCVGFSQVISKDLIPLLTTMTSANTTATTTAAVAQYSKIIPKLIKLLSYLTSPIECLVSAEFGGTEEGQQVVFEIQTLLNRVKIQFTEFKVTKAVVEYLRNVTRKNEILSPEECGGVSDGLLLLRNILHIPNKEAGTQHQILWNLFAHSIDKILLNLMTCDQKSLWAIALVQLIALIYKDQHVTHLQKLLNSWLENSCSEESSLSEELDNESNTSPQDQSSSTTLTSDPTSDSSDNGGVGNSNKRIELSKRSLGSIFGIKCNDNENADQCTDARKHHDDDGGKCPLKVNNVDSQKDNFAKEIKSKESNKCDDADSGISCSHFSRGKKARSVVEGSKSNSNINSKQCGSSSSGTRASSYHNHYNGKQQGHENNNNGDLKVKSNGKQRASKLTTSYQQNPVTTRMIPQFPSTISSSHIKSENKRRKLHKRSKKTKLGNHAMIHHNATEDDISHVLREFTVDFLLKGYGSLVGVLEKQLSHNNSLQMDKSHFLWLITYFLKFASQMELDLSHLTSVLSQSILSYLTFEGVSMCENLALCKEDLKPHLRRMHLVVTALREFVQAVEIYSKLPSCSKEDKGHINVLQYQMLSVEELRHLFLLLIRYFKPGVQTKQYLQDLVITNHVVLLLLEKISSKDEFKGEFQMCEFLKEFSSPLIMQQYGHLLEDFQNNGEFVNDCVFTMMHHIAGELESPEALYQPSILKTFSSIWEVEFSIKDDWADLIEYVIQRFMKASDEEKKQIFKSGTSNSSDDTIGWSKEDFNNLFPYYSKCSSLNDPIAKILELYGKSDSEKTRESILNQLLHQRIIGYNQFLRFLASERSYMGERGDGDATDGQSSTSSSQATAGSSCRSIAPLSPLDEGYCQMDPSKLPRNGPIINRKENNDVNQETIDDHSHHCISIPSTELGTPMDNIEIAKLIKQLIGEGHDLSWLQNQVLEACFVKHSMESKLRRKSIEIDEGMKDSIESETTTNAASISYHYSLLGQSIPIVPWTHWQELLLRSPLYLLLLHKLGFHLPCDVGKLFPRIPHFWTADVLLSIAEKLGPLPKKERMKFDPTDVINNAMETISSIEEMNEGGNVKEEVLKRSDEGLGIHLVPGQELTLTMPAIISPHSSYGFGSTTHSVNWMTLVHKSKHFIDRHSEPVESNSSTTSDESDVQMEEYSKVSEVKAEPTKETTVLMKLDEMDQGHNVNTEKYSQ